MSHWSIESPLSKSDFFFGPSTTRSLEVTRQRLQPVLHQGVQWARDQGATNVPVPTYGELVVTLFNDSGAPPDEVRALEILGTVLREGPVAEMWIGEALRAILQQRSPQSQRVRRQVEQRFLAEQRALSLDFLDELFANSNQPSTTMNDHAPRISSSVPPAPVFFTPSPLVEELAVRMNRLELDRDAMLRRLTAAAPPPVPSPAQPPAKGDKKPKVAVASTPGPVPAPILSPPSVSPSSGEDTDGEDSDSVYDGMPSDAMGMAGLNARAEPSVTPSFTIPDEERGVLDKEALSPEKFINLMDHKRWPAMCRAHKRDKVLKEFVQYYEEFTHRRRHDAVAFITILRAAAAICEEDLTSQASKHVRLHVLAQIKAVIDRFEFWRAEFRQGTAAAAAGEAASQNQNFPKGIQEARKATERVAAKAEKSAPPAPAGKAPQKPGGKKGK